MTAEKHMVSVVTTLVLLQRGAGGYLSFVRLGSAPFHQSSGYLRLAHWVRPIRWIGCRSLSPKLWLFLAGTLGEVLSLLSLLVVPFFVGLGTAPFHQSSGYFWLAHWVRPLRDLVKWFFRKAKARARQSRQPYGAWH